MSDLKKVLGTKIGDFESEKGEKVHFTHCYVCYPKEDNENVNNPAFGEGAVLMANGQTNFNPESNMLDRVKNNDFTTEDKTV